MTSRGTVEWNVPERIATATFTTVGASSSAAPWVSSTSAVEGDYWRLRPVSRSYASM